MCDFSRGSVWYGRTARTCSDKVFCLVVCWLVCTHVFLGVVLLLPLRGFGLRLQDFIPLRLSVGFRCLRNGAVCLFQPLAASFCAQAVRAPWYVIHPHCAPTCLATRVVTSCFCFMTLKIPCQALSDLSLVFRNAVLGTSRDVLTMYADVLKDRSANRVSTTEREREKHNYCK